MSIERRQPAAAETLLASPTVDTVFALSRAQLVFFFNGCLGHDVLQSRDQTVRQTRRPGGQEDLAVLFLAAK